MKTISRILLLTLFVGGLTILSCSDDDDIALSSDAAITSFSFDEQSGPADIDNIAHTVDIKVKYGTDRSNLTPSIESSEGSSIGNIPTDYTNPVTIPVIAESGVTQNWTVTVEPEPRDDTDILLFALAEQTSLGIINKTDHTVAIEVVNGTDLTSLTPNFLISLGATSDPANETTGDYSSEVTIKVTAEDGTTTQDWTVNVIEAANEVSSETDILSFTLPEQSREAVIDGNNHEVFVEVVSGTELANLSPTFRLSPGATSVPESGATSDYSSLVTITVTAEDGTTKQDWTVYVYPADDFNPSIFCDENLCTANEALQDECQEFLITCLITEDGRNYDECLIAALSICR